MSSVKFIDLHEKLYVRIRGTNMSKSMDMGGITYTIGRGTSSEHAQEDKNVQTQTY